MDIYEELLALLDGLNDAQIDYALCGGLAVGLHGYLRFTQDIDLLIQAENLDEAIEIARSLEFTFDAGIVPFGVGTPEQREVRRLSKTEEQSMLTVDFMIVSAILQDVWDDRGEVEWEGRRVQVVSLNGLKKMKLLAGRDQDILDLKQLGLINDDRKESNQTQTN